MKELLSLLDYRKLSLLLLFFQWITLTAQTVTVSDDTGETLVGVEVWQTNGDFSGLTDVSGHIDISTWDRMGQLRFRFLGYEELSMSHDQLMEMDHRVTLRSKSLLINEVVIFGRNQYDTDELPMQIETITPKELSNTAPQSAADALSQHAGVYVQKSQMGGGSPIIRGFEANRVLLVVDDVRMNNAIYRNGHLQNAITIDPSILSRVDVIFGPNSLLYGSDALGGVVHFQTKEMPFSTTDQTQTNGAYYLRHSTANNEWSEHIDFSIATPRFSSMTSVTYHDFDDLRSGGQRDDRFPTFGLKPKYQATIDGEDVTLPNPDPNVQIGTGYNQLDIYQKVNVKLSDRTTLKTNIQYSTSTDIPRYDNLSEYRDGTLRFAEWHYGPQNRFLAAATIQHIGETSWYDDIKWVNAYQRLDEDRISRPFGDVMQEIQQEDVHVWSSTLDMTKLFSEQLRLDYGVDVQYNSVGSSAYEEDYRTGELGGPILSRYASRANHLTNMGTYVFISEHRDDFYWNAGLRYARSNFYLRYDETDPVQWTQELIDGVSSSNDALTGSVGAQWRPTDQISMNTVIATAFRSPNIDDLSKIRVNGEEITFPNFDLQPESSFNYELGIDWTPSEDFAFQIIGYQTHLSNVIVREELVGIDYVPTYINNGDTLRITINQNLDKARIFGLTTQLKAQLTDHIKLDASYVFTKGISFDRRDEEAPLAHIPPGYGQVGLSYTGSRLDIQYVGRFNAMKDIVDFGGSVDNPDLATPIGSLSWYTHNIYTQFALFDHLDLNVGIENILDIHYRPFASGVSAPGRNIIVTLQGRF